MEIGEKIIELRKKHNLTQEKLSEELKITRQTLSNWENGITTPDIIQAKNIAKYFKISLDDLTNNNLAVNCFPKSVLSNLIGKKCYIDMLTDDYNEIYRKECIIIDTNNEFIKFSFKKKNKVIEKLIDTNLISSIKVVEKENDK